MTVLDISSYMTDEQAVTHPHQQNKEGFSGFMVDVNLSDIVQLACLESRDRKLFVQSSGKDGEIFFSKGEVVHARAKGLKGEGAFYEIMSWDRGTFRLYHESPPEHSIDMPWNFLLIESLRRKDEMARQPVEGQRHRPKVLIVDDSKFFVSRLRELLNNQLSVQVIAEAANGKEALESLIHTAPDLILLDINMPVMAGDIALKHIMIKSPAPVLLVSSFNERYINKIMEYLQLGAVDFVAKPIERESWDKFTTRLEQVISRESGFRIRNIRRARKPRQCSEKEPPQVSAKKILIVLGGIGGLLEIQKIMPDLILGDQCCLLMFQEMSPDFSDPVSGYLDRCCAYSVNVLAAGVPLLGNQAWIAGLDKKWVVRADRSGAKIFNVYDNNGGFDANELLVSLSNTFQGNLSVLLLSGIDLDITRGLGAVSARGGYIVAQKPETSLYPGPLEDILSLNLENASAVPEEMAALLNKRISRY